MSEAGIKRPKETAMMRSKDEVGAGLGSYSCELVCCKGFKMSAIVPANL
jgi:hypothetical protein